jgi:hypothetical protein
VELKSVNSTTARIFNTETSKEKLTLGVGCHN